MLQICSYGKGSTQGDGASHSPSTASTTRCRRDPRVAAHPRHRRSPAQARARAPRPPAAAAQIADIVAVNQDAAGLPPRVAQASRTGAPPRRARSRRAGLRAAALGRQPSARPPPQPRQRAGEAVEATWAEPWLCAAGGGDGERVRRCSSRAPAGSATGAYSATVAPHDVSFVASTISCSPGRARRTRGGVRPAGDLRESQTSAFVFERPRRAGSAVRRVALARALTAMRNEDFSFDARRSRPPIARAVSS